ncbi:MAG: TIGR01244 family sulfur transferase [Pseudomonadota bacterium]|nr:TIGR01244 family sulfur transferase [Pseudomonadota bacterium]
MALPLNYVAPDVAAAPQLTPEQMHELAAAGFRTVVNNRPDGEGGPQQPRNDDLRAAAQAAGLDYVYLPVQSGHMTADNVTEFAQLLQDKPRPLVAFCRSGTRSANLYLLAASEKSGGAKR